MVNMPEEWKAILDALIAAPIAWQTPEQIAAELGRDVEETTDLLCLMDVAGWIAVWDGDVELRVTLSPIAAYRLKVVLVEFSRSAPPRWAHVDDPEPPEPRVRRLSSLERHVCLERFIDPDACPELAAERSERVHQHVRSSLPERVNWAARELPQPSTLLGLSLSPWPGPAQIGRRAACPACNGRPLRPQAYCLCCDRWGLDGLVAALARRSPVNWRRALKRASRKDASWLAPALPERFDFRKNPADEPERAKRKARRQARRHDR